jgi:hypothetical protein
MKKLIMAFWILTMLALAACGTASPTTAPTAESGGTTGGGGDTSGGPAAAVQAYFEALVTGDTETANSAYCEAANVPTPSASAVIPGATYDFSGLTYTVSNETADTATVTVDGSYTVTASGVDTPIPMPGVPYNVTNENGAWKICG